MTRLQLVSDSGTDFIPPHASAVRRERGAPRLYLVADTGSRYRPAQPRKPASRQGGWLGLVVAIAAASMSLLVATAGFEQTASGAADWQAAPTRPFAAPAGPDFASGD